MYRHPILQVTINDIASSLRAVAQPLNSFITSMLLKTKHKKMAWLQKVVSALSYAPKQVS